MMQKIARLFIIKNRIEACAIIYALALGAAERGKHYLDLFPGFPGRMLFVAAMVAVFMAGAKIMDALTYERGLPKAQPAQLDSRLRGNDEK